MSVKIYGIKNCSSMKKAFDWLDQNQVDYTFHDYKKAGIDTLTLTRWCARSGWKALVNTRGTTWRKLDPALQTVASDRDAISVMVEHTSVIRRPVVETPSGDLLIGFDADAFAHTLSHSDMPGGSA